MRHLVIFDKGLAYHHTEGKIEPLNVQGWIYDIDEYGNLLTRKPTDEMAVGIFNNHSSMPAGKPVICAGILSAVQGQITKIDNNSGHYKPTKDDLRNAISILNEYGVNLNALEVSNNTPGDAFDINAAQFLFRGTEPTQGVKRGNVTMGGQRPQPRRGPIIGGQRQ